MYTFNLDTSIRKIITYSDKKANQFLLLISKENFKVTFNLTKEPLNFVSNSFQHNEINNIYFMDNKYYLCGNRGRIFIFDSLFQYVTEIVDMEISDILYINKWKSLYIILSNDGYARVSEFNEQIKQINTLFRVPVGRDSPTTLFSLDKLQIMGNNDNKIYMLDIENELELYRERMFMKEEERTSTVYNNLLKAKASKKKKKPTSEKKKNTVKNVKIKISSSKEKSKEKRSTVGGENQSKSKENKKAEKKEIKLKLTNSNSLEKLKNKESFGSSNSFNMSEKPESGKSISERKKQSKTVVSRKLNESETVSYDNKDLSMIKEERFDKKFKENKEIKETKMEEKKRNKSVQPLKKPKK